MRSVYIEGIGFWASRLPGWEAARAALRGEAPALAANAPRPAPTLLAPTERRRAPDTVAVALEVAAAACANAGRDPKTMASVFASTHGDLAISDYMCDTLAKTPSLISPTRFHNSVHNAAAGYWTIGTGCLAPYTAITAHVHTFGQGLLESISQNAGDNMPVLYVAYDIESRGPLATMAQSRGLLGAAVVLSNELTSAAKARLVWEVEEVPVAEPSRARAENAALVAGNAMEDCLVFFEALAESGNRSVAFTLGPRLELHLQIELLA